MLLQSCAQISYNLRVWQGKNAKGINASCCSIMLLFQFQSKLHFLEKHSGALIVLLPHSKKVHNLGLHQEDEPLHGVGTFSFRTDELSPAL